MFKDSSMLGSVFSHNDVLIFCIFNNYLSVDGYILSWGQLESLNEPTE